MCLPVQTIEESNRKGMKFELKFFLMYSRL